jgi:hypothetical protein
MFKMNINIKASVLKEAFQACLFIVTRSWGGLLTSVCSDDVESGC